MNHEEQLTDSSPCPIGKHKGRDMEAIPASWLVWYYNAYLAKGKADTFNKPVIAYIEDNLDVLEKELKKK